MGSPKGGDPQGDGATTVVGERESRSQGEGWQVNRMPEAEVCVMQNADALLDIYQKRGTRWTRAMNGSLESRMPRKCASPVRRGAVGNLLTVDSARRETP